MLITKFMDTLEELLKLGEPFDREGGGILALTQGRFTTRFTCAYELFVFLAYIAGGCSVINDAQLFALQTIKDEILNGLDGEYPEDLSIEESARIDIDMSNVTPKNTLAAFQQADTIFSEIVLPIMESNGIETPSISYTDNLVQSFETLGQLMVDMNYSPDSENRYAIAINKTKKAASDNPWSGCFS